MGRAERRQKSRREFLDSVWTASEKKHGTRVPLESRQFLEAYKGMAEPQMYPDEDDVHFVIDEFIEHGFPALNRYLAEMMASRGRSGTVGKNNSAEALKGRRVYAKPLAKRLHRLNFVAELVVPFANLVQGSFDRAGRPIPWDHVEARWNQAHPDEKTSAKALERAFRRDRDDQRLRELYFDGEFRDWARQADHLRPILKPLELSGRRPQDLFVRSMTFDSSRLADALSPETASAFARAGWPKDWLVVSAKYPAETVRALRRSARARRTADRATRQRHMTLVCKGRACKSTSAMLVHWSPATTTVLKGSQCNECPVASRMMRKLPSGGENGAA